MAEISNELIYEVLKKVQRDVADIRLRVESHDEQLKSIRHILVAMQSGDLHHEATIAGLRADVDTIKQHLSLSDA
jgi:hypothetical protein